MSKITRDLEHTISEILILHIISYHIMHYCVDFMLGNGGFNYFTHCRVAFEFCPLRSINDNTLIYLLSIFCIINLLLLISYVTKLI